MDCHRALQTGTPTQVTFTPLNKQLEATKYTECALYDGSVLWYPMTATMTRNAKRKTKQKPPSANKVNETVSSKRVQYLKAMQASRVEQAESADDTADTPEAAEEAQPKQSKRARMQ
jgi:hypothetical protein